MNIVGLVGPVTQIAIGVMLVLFSACHAAVIIGNVTVAATRTVSLLVIEWSDCLSRFQAYRCNQICSLLL